MDEETNTSEQQSTPELKPGTNLGHGKVVGKNGEVEDSAGKRLTHGAVNAGKIAAAVATGGGSEAGMAGEVAGEAGATGAMGAAGEAGATQGLSGAAGGTPGLPGGTGSTPGLPKGTGGTPGLPGEAGGTSGLPGELGGKPGANNLTDPTKMGDVNKATNNLDNVQDPNKAKGASNNFDKNKLKEDYKKAKEKTKNLDEANNKFDLEGEIGGAIDKFAEHDPISKGVVDLAADWADQLRVIDAIEKLLQFDLAGSWEELKKAAKGSFNYNKKLILIIIFPLILGLILLVSAVIIIIGPTIGLYIEATETIHEIAENVSDFVTDIIPLDGDEADDVYDPSMGNETWGDDLVAEVTELISPEILDKVAVNDSQIAHDRALLCSQVPGFKSLSQKRRDIMFTAATLVAMNYTYLGCVASDADGKCTQWASCLWYKQPGGGLAALGGCVVCDTYVGWIYNTNYNENIWVGGVKTGVPNTFLNSGRAVEITQEELKPGDIGWSNGHVGLYAGDGMWFHAAGKAYGVIKGRCPKFTRFARFV